MHRLSLVALTLTACSYGVLPAEETGAPPPASKPPLAGAPEAPETAPPPPPRNAEEGCPGIDPQGQCRGSVAIWCEGGQVRSVDCAGIGRACEFIDDQTGYYCGSPVGGAPPPEENPEEDQADPPIDPGAPPPPAPEPDEGAPPQDEGAPPPDEGEPPPPNPPEGGAPPPPAPDPPEEAPPPPEGEGAPQPPAGPPAEEPADPCGGVTYQGHCEGDIAVWCDGQQVHRDDCAANGLTCGFIDDQTGYYCREADAEEPGAPAPPVPDPAEPAPPPPDEGAPPPPENGCGDIDFFGVCEGAVVVYCSNGALVRYDCGPSNTTCGWVNDEIGNWCVEL